MSSPPPPPPAKEESQAGAVPESETEAAEDAQPSLETTMSGVQASGWSSNMSNSSRAMDMSPKMTNEDLEKELPTDEQTPSPENGANDSMLFRRLSDYERNLVNEQFEGSPAKESMLNMMRKRIKTTLQDQIAAFYIYIRLTVTFEALIVMANAVGATIFFLEYEDDRSGELIAAKLDMSFLAFSVTFPLTYLLGQAFGRREQALQHAADFRSILTSIVCADLTWDFPSAITKNWGGRAELPSTHNRLVRDTGVEMAEILYQYLSIPWLVGRARNFVFRHDSQRVQEVVAVRLEIEQRFAILFRQLYGIVETMKATGMPGNESSRINQYVWFLQQRINLLRNQKIYRTPQATRSFGRVYLFVLPWFLGPYFAWVYEETENYGMALAISCLTFLVLLGLITAGRALEDPFLQENGFDNIKLKHDIALLIQTIDFHFDRAEEIRLSAEAAKKSNPESATGY
ncbi:Hypothetical Protein FCC1311_000222 [Hondaea fermentalgiana]|uniref:Uncharacterized protein n=1 Tax=Hondaea fermentalgiana TaxID=2315210 RepID=A0A2R5FYG9_9STRA|nr:Hypothetical Protein FCC1311_000222 [Hondaea fermentalgiana]|eukprot:GBG23802.1 Hypothetical Protein FCC1311_000222 [Hondaea fermentalgiana]